MGYAVNKDRDLCLQNSYTLARQAEQTYKSLIDAKLLDSLDRMSGDHYQAKPMPDDFHAHTLARVRQKLGK